ncbi:MAG TPA: type II toxin-antitoxin system VapC family toxin [Candidatus Binataceae bacterium]|nr:type II toxin-antitoxin system VapC family toxin [Candidatus Binataceae bacterium]
MPTYLLDTSVIVDVLNAKRGRSQLLAGLLSQGHTLACCPINVAEVYAGMRPHEAAATGSFLRSLAYFEISWEIAKLAGELRFHHARRGRTLSLADTLIAAVALSHDLTLVTDNVKDYPMAGLRVIAFG